MAGTAAADIAAQIIAGTMDCSLFADMSCQLFADAIAATPSAALAGSACRAAILTRAQGCLGEPGVVFAPGFWDSLALSPPADALAGFLEGGLLGSIGKIALTLLLVAAGFAMILLGLRQLASPVAAPQPTE